MFVCKRCGQEYDILYLGRTCLDCRDVVEEDKKMNTNGEGLCKLCIHCVDYTC